MLKIRNLQKSYKNHEVLKDLNMTIGKGDVYGFLGTNGCGKTTTMNIICNIITKDAGAVEFGGETPLTDSEQIAEGSAVSVNRAKLKIGYLPETPSLYGYMNGYEYLDFIGACCNYGGDIKARTAEVLDITGMTGGAKRLIRGYSRGMNQRIGIAAALYAKPDLLILDEPTSALDPEGRAEVMEIIRRLADAGSTIILCTHILTDVERVANKIGILRNGVMAVEGAIKDVKEKVAGRNVIAVRLRDYAPEAVNRLCGIECLEKSEINYKEGIGLYAKDGVDERELYNQVTGALKDGGIIPEAVEFRRMSLEQIYIGVTNGSLDKFIGGAV